MSWSVCAYFSHLPSTTTVKEVNWLAFRWDRPNKRHSIAVITTNLKKLFKNIYNQQLWSDLSRFQWLPLKQYWKTVRLEFKRQSFILHTQIIDFIFNNCTIDLSSSLIMAVAGCHMISVKTTFSTLRRLFHLKDRKVHSRLHIRNTCTQTHRFYTLLARYGCG